MKLNKLKQFKQFKKLNNKLALISKKLSLISKKLPMEKNRSKLLYFNNHLLFEIENLYKIGSSKTLNLRKWDTVNFSHFRDQADFLLNKINIYTNFTVK